MGRFCKIPFTLYLYVKDVNPLLAIIYTYNNILSILNIFCNGVALFSCWIIYLY